MGKKIWLSMHPRNFGPDKNRPYVRTSSRGEISRKANGNAQWNFFSIKRVGRRFHAVVVENKAMCKKVFCTCKVVFFLLIRPIVFCCSRCRRRLALHDFVFCLSKLQVYYYRELRFQPWLNLYILSKRKPQNKHHTSIKIRWISMLHSTNNVVKLDSNGLIYKIAV